ncbi:MAG: SoxR reducing system RseC family protein [Treponema sp.]|nr:SoxR reducing system RseC family protein [Treponema sp.]
MTNLAIVKKSSGSQAEVKLLKTSSCINCVSDCVTRQKSFVVDNPKNLELKPGDYVTIQLPPLISSLQGLFSLFFPILFTASAYLAIKNVKIQFFMNLNELKIFGLTALALIVSIAFVTILSRIRIRAVRYQIAGVL